jgi:hypothetical protein
MWLLSDWTASTYHPLFIVKKQTALRVKNPVQEINQIISIATVEIKVWAVVELQKDKEWEVCYQWGWLER